MKLSKQQREILDFLTKHEEEIKQLTKTANREEIGELEIGDSVTIAGIKWSKFAEDENGNSMMLADESVCEMKFGKNNDWRESEVREKCKEIAEKIKKELGEDAIVAFETDLFSHDGLRDYGAVEDEVALLTYDMYRNKRENIKELDDLWWLLTPDSTPSGYGSDYVRYVVSGGSVDCGWCSGTGSVRPFCILAS